MACDEQERRGGARAVRRDGGKRKRRMVLNTKPASSTYTISSSASVAAEFFSGRITNDTATSARHLLILAQPLFCPLCNTKPAHKQAFVSYTQTCPPLVLFADLQLSLKVVKHRMWLPCLCGAPLHYKYLYVRAAQRATGHIHRLHGRSPFSQVRQTRYKPRHLGVSRFLSGRELLYMQSTFVSLFSFNLQKKLICSLS